MIVVSILTVTYKVLGALERQDPKVAGKWCRQLEAVACLSGATRVNRAARVLAGILSGDTSVASRRHRAVMLLARSVEAHECGPARTASTTR